MVKGKIAQINSWEITIGCLELIPILDTTELKVDVLDTSVTKITRAGSRDKERIRNDKGKLESIIKIRPEVEFKLIKSEGEPVSLQEIYLPNWYVLASKAVIIEDECVKERSGKSEYYTKIVFNLFVYTKQGLQERQLSSDERERIVEERIRRLTAKQEDELEETRAYFRGRIEAKDILHRENIKDLQDQLAERDETINDLMLNIPNQFNQRAKTFIKKMKHIPTNIK